MMTVELFYYVYLPIITVSREYSIMYLFGKLYLCMLRDMGITSPVLFVKICKIINNVLLVIELPVTLLIYASMLFVSRNVYNSASAYHNHRIDGQNIRELPSYMSQPL